MVSNIYKIWSPYIGAGNRGRTCAFWVEARHATNNTLPAICIYIIYIYKSTPVFLKKQQLFVKRVDFLRRHTHEAPTQRGIEASYQWSGLDTSP